MTQSPLLTSLLRCLATRENIRACGLVVVVFFLFTFLQRINPPPIQCQMPQWYYKLNASMISKLLTELPTDQEMRQSRNVRHPMNTSNRHDHFVIFDNHSDESRPQLTSEGHSASIPTGHKCNVVDMHLSPAGKFSVVPLKTSPKMVICIYPNVNDDRYVSGSIKRGQVWEGGLIAFVKRHLLADPKMGLFDIGANIGEYSLVSAKIGHKVVAVEALKHHVDMVHKSAILNNVTDRITLLHNAVSNEYRTVQMLTVKGNMGATHIQNMPASGAAQQKAKQVRTVLMDDLLEVTSFERALMKIDIEGHEPYAFANASRLFAKIHIPFILMEWGNLKTVNNPTKVGLIKKMIQFFTDRHYNPIVGQKVLGTKDWRKWPWDIMWKHKDARF